MASFSSLTAVARCLIYGGEYASRAMTIIPCYALFSCFKHHFESKGILQIPKNQRHLCRVNGIIKSEGYYAVLRILLISLNEPRREKTGFLPMRKQRRRSASR